MKKPSQTTTILIALVLGAVFGLVLPSYGQSVSFLGDIFLKLVQMSLPLLILGQVVAAVSQLNLRDLGKMGGSTLAIFIFMTFIATIWGVLFGVIFQPGAGLNLSEAAAGTAEAANQSLIDVIIGFFPDNIMQSLSEGSMMQITVFALIFGSALSLLQDESVKEMSFTNLLNEFNDIIMKMMKLVMYTAPIGVFSLTANAMGTYGLEVIGPMLYYVLVFFLAAVSYMLIWHIITAIYTKENLWTLIKQTLNMTIFAFAVNSSAVALPTQMKDSQEKLGISEEATSFIMPLGMSLNSPVSAMSNSIVLVIAGQMHNLNFGFSEYVMIVFIATFASYATAVIPGGGIVSLNMVLPQMGFGPETIAIFATVDWPTGMTRTMGNVNLDASTGVMVADGLGELDKEVLRGNKKIDETTKVNNK